MNRLSIASVLILILLISAARAQSPLVIEAESLTGATIDPSSPVKAILFDESRGQLDYQAPQTLPAGPVWAMIVARQQKPADHPTELLLTADTQPGMTVSIDHSDTDQFGYYRTAGQSDGQKRPTISLLFIKGAPILIDRIEFHVGRTIPLPAPSPTAPAQIFIVSSKSAASKAEAAAIHERLSRMKAGVSIPPPVEGALTSTPNPGDLVVVCCDEWTDPASLKWLPLWSDQIASIQGLWAFKSAGILGNWAALGLRPGGGKMLNDRGLRDLLATGTHVSAALTHGPSIPSDPLIWRMDNPHKALALAAAQIPSPWNQPTPPAQWHPDLPQADAYPAALGNWLYRQSEWGLNETERKVYGWYFFNWAAMTEPKMKESSVKATIATAEMIVQARALQWAARAFSEQPEAAAWQSTAAAVLKKAQRDLAAESMRDRLASARALQESEGLSGGRFPILKPLLKGISALAVGPDPQFGLEGEPLHLHPADLRGIKIERSKTTGMQLTRLPLLPSSMQKSSPQAFDKIVLANEALSAVVDGISSPGGPDNAASLLRYSAGNQVWITSPQGAPNGLKATINTQPLKFEPLARLQGAVNGPANALAVIQRNGEKGEVWQRGVFLLGKSSALVVLDQLQANGSGPLTLESHLHVNGMPTPKPPEMVTFEQQNAKIQGHALSQIRTSLINGWAQTWSAQNVPDKPVFLRTAFLPVEAPAPQPIAAPGIRLADKTAVFLGPVDAPGLNLRARAAIIAPDEAILSGVTLATLTSPLIEATQPVDLVLTATGLEVTASSPGAMLALHEPLHAPQGPQVTLSAGKTTIPLSAQDAAAALQALIQAAGQVPTGEYGPASETRTEAALPATLTLKTSVPSSDPLTTATQIPDGSSSRVLFGTQKGQLLIAGEDGKTRLFASIPGPVLALERVSYGADRFDIVAATTNGTLHRLDAKGASIGTVSLGAEVLKMTPLDVEGDDLQELAILTSKALAILDPLGQVGWKTDFADEPTAISIVPGTDGRTAVILGTIAGGRHVVGLKEDGSTDVFDAGKANGAITACAAIDVNADGRSEAVFGTENGLLSTLDLSTRQFVWEHSTGAAAVRAIAPSGDPKAPVLIGSAGKFICKMPGAVGLKQVGGTVAKILPVASQTFNGFAILTETPSLLILRPDGAIHAQLQLKDTVREMFLDGGFHLATDKSVDSYDLRAK